MKPNEIALFYTGALGAMRTAKFDIQPTDDAIPDEVMVAVADFEDVHGKLEAAENAAETLEIFSAFLKTYSPPKSAKLVNIAFTVPVGRGTMTFTFEPLAEDIESVLKSIRTDVATILQNRALAADTNGGQASNSNQNFGSSANSGQAQGQTQSMAGTNETLETWPVTAVTKKRNDKGQFQIRIHGGRWSQFGVAIYPDVLERFPGFNTNVNNMAEGTLSINPGITATVSLVSSNGGQPKPKRVTNLTGTN